MEMMEHVHQTKTLPFDDKANISSQASASNWYQGLSDIHIWSLETSRHQKLQTAMCA
jgi:hypothetical protein